ncbi:MAG: hypothetical protein ACF8XB_23185, partial [Planctomycetota bacterium JB042]
PHGKRAACHAPRVRETGERNSADGRWEVPRLTFGGHDIRYVISFVLPRFLFLEPHEQAEDIVHELLHVDPSFGGWSSPLRHGARYDARVRALARAALGRGLSVPPLAAPGDTVLYRRLRPFPHPLRRRDRMAKWTYDDDDLETAALHLDPRDREPPPPRYLYRCPSCETLYPRQRPLRMASCGDCASGYDARFKLKLVRGSRGSNESRGEQREQGRGR